MLFRSRDRQCLSLFPGAPAGVPPAGASGGPFSPARKGGKARQKPMVSGLPLFRCLRGRGFNAASLWRNLGTPAATTSTSVPVSPGPASRPAHRKQSAAPGARPIKTVSTKSGEQREFLEPQVLSVLLPLFLRKKSGERFKKRNCPVRCGAPMEPRFTPRGGRENKDGPPGQQKRRNE